MKLINKLSLILILGISFLMSGCDKTKLYDVAVPPPVAHFTATTAQVVYSVVTDPTPSFSVEVGTSDVTASDRTVSFNITSPSGALAGTQYSVTGGNTVTIPANSAVANIVIQANYAEYAGGRKDTLIIALTTPSVEVATFQDTLRVILKGPNVTACDEGNPDLNVLLGDYANTNELLGTSPYGPYQTSISSVTPTSATTATIVVENIWDNGWGPISFDIDWTDPANLTVTTVQQNAIPGSDAGDLNATYAGQTIAVRQSPTSSLGTYTTCGDQTLTLNMQLGVTNLGWFNVLYQVNMAR